MSEAGAINPEIDRRVGFDCTFLRMIHLCHPFISEYVPREKAGLEIVSRSANGQAPGVPIGPDPIVPTRSAEPNRRLLRRAILLRVHRTFRIPHEIAQTYYGIRPAGWRRASAGLAHFLR